MRVSCLRPLATATRLLVPVSFTLALSSAAASAATLTGRVTDPDGRAVAGARVVVATSLGTLADRATDAGGRFVIDALAEGRYDVRVVAEGMTADPIAVTLARDESRVVDVMLRLSAIAESIVVSASQVDVPLSRAPDTVTVVTAADLRARQIDTLADALRLVPGLTVARSGGRGAITSLFPRGGGSNYTLVLVDGVRANAFGGGYDFGHLTVSDIDRIEIVRGPQSALFGSDAVGAVVQVLTRRGGAPRAEALVEGGSQAATRAAVAAAGARGAWSWGAGAERSRSDGYTGIAPASGERVTNDDDRLTRVSGSVEWQRPGGLDLLVTTHISRDERGFPGPFGSNPIGVFGGVDRVSRGINNTRRLGARASHPWSPAVRQRVEIGVLDLSSDFSSAFGDSASGSRRIDARIQEDAAISTGLGVSAGVAWLRERGSSTFITGTSDQPVPIRRSVTGVFGELRYGGRERLFVTAGLRLEHLTRDSVESNVGLFSSRPAFSTQTVDSLNPKLAVSYLAAVSMDGRRSSRLHASAGTGIRPPDAFEIAFTDNPDLKPERSRSIDAGVEQRIAGGALVLGATAFFNRYDDLLVTVGRSLASASRYKTDNISNARARGLEATGDARLGAAVTIRGFYTFLDSEILSVDGLDRLAPPPFKVGDALIRRPRHQGTIEVAWAAGRVTAYGQLTSRSRVLDVEPNFGGFGGLFFASGYSVINLGAALRVRPHLEVYARVRNLADRAYEEVLGFPALGRNGIVGVRVASGR